MVIPLLLAAAVLGLGAATQHIVSTSPSITEMLYALGLGDRVVGVTTYCHYPPEAMKKPKIGDYLHPNLETIVALRPDLVIAETTGVKRPERLSSLHLNVLDVDDGSVAGIYDSIAKIGAAAGVPERARALDARIRAALDAVRLKTAGRPVRVMFVLGRTPGRLEDIVVAGRGSYLDELLRIAGGANIFGESASPYPKVTLEEVLARNPEVIIDMGEMSQTIGVTAQDRQRVVELWGRYPSLEAVRRGRVFAVASDIFVVPGPRVVDAAREFARMLHPEARL